jgi:hypothetical protein
MPGCSRLDKTLSWGAERTEPAAALVHRRLVQLFERHTAAADGLATQ